MNYVIHTKMGEGRRVAIPAELCQRDGLEPGVPWYWNRRTGVSC